MSRWLAFQRLLHHLGQLAALLPRHSGGEGEPFDVPGQTYPGAHRDIVLLSALSIPFLHFCHPFLLTGALGLSLLVSQLFDLVPQLGSLLKFLLPDSLLQLGFQLSDLLLSRRLLDFLHRDLPYMGNLSMDPFH